MSVLDDLAAYLESKTAITDLTNSPVRSNRLRQGDDLPAIVLTSVSYNPSYNLQGQTDTNSETVQIDCYARKDPRDARTLAEQVRLALSGYRGDMGSVKCRGAVVRSSRDLATAPKDSSDSWTPRVSVDYEIFYPQTVPTFPQGD